MSPSHYMQWGNTPLLKASWNGHAEVTRFLLESGSSVQEQNNVGGQREQVLSVLLPSNVIFAVVCVSVIRF